MVGPQTDEFVERPGPARLVLLVGAAVAVVVLGLSFLQARDRVATGQAVDAIGRNTVDLVITQPPEPAAFAEATVWTLPSQAARFEADDTGQTFVRLNASTGILVGSEGPDGLVGLALFPPGFEPGSSEVLISPASTALAVVALHPDVSSSDPDTLISRLAAAVASPSFTALAERVDGRPLSSWGSQEQQLLREVVADSILTRLSFPCPSPETNDPPISICDGSTELLNGSHRSIVVADADGMPCAIVPGSRSTPSADSLRSLRRIVSDGIIEPVSDMVAMPGGAVVPCGSRPAVLRNPAQLELANRAVSFVDVSIPLARLVGAGDHLTHPTDLDEVLATLLTDADITALSGTPGVAAQLRAGIDIVRTPAAWSALGLAPVDDPTLERLDQLATLLEGLYP